MLKTEEFTGLSSESSYPFKITNTAGQHVIIENANKNQLLEFCIKFLKNMDYKITYNNGSHIKAENKVYYSSFIEILLEQDGCAVKLHMQDYGELFYTEPVNDSVMYLNLIMSIYRCLRREIPLETINQLSKFRNKV